MKSDKMADVVRELLDQHFPEKRETSGSEPLAEMQKHDSVTFRNHDVDETAT